MKKLFLTLFAFQCLFPYVFSQNTGINTTTPRTTLDVNGDMSLRMGVITIGAFTNADVNTTIDRKSIYRITGGSPLGFNISGFTGGTDGRIITMINASTSQMALENDGAGNGSSAANRILTSDGSSLYLQANGAVTLIYDATASRWRVSSFSKSPPFVPDPLWYMDANSNMYNLNGGKVGIGITTPAEKLDLNGNLNITGTIKTNGAAGIAGQVLTSNGATMVWGNIGTQYKYVSTFDCSNITSIAGTGNCNFTWTVPTGVANILVEGWGGGGGGGNLGSGGGGAYISTRYNVNQGDVITLIVGAGGINGVGYSNGIGINGIIGGDTKITAGSVTVTAGGGPGGLVKVDGTNNNGNPRAKAGFIGTQESIGYYGGAGKISVTSYLQISSGVFAKQTNYADGGDAALMPESGGQGGRSLGFGTAPDTYGTVGQQPGGGGGADYLYGQPGMGGRIIIHY